MIALEAQPSRLSKGIYEEDKSGNPGPFTLINFQYRQEEVRIPQATWFNGHGERVGFGDLAVRDLKRIGENIPIGEIFVVLPMKPGISLSSDDNGLKYISCNFDLLITRYEVLGQGSLTKPRVVSKLFAREGFEMQGLDLEPLSQRDAEILLRVANTH